METVQQIRRYPDENIRLFDLIIDFYLTIIFKDRLPKLVYLRIDGERYQLEDPGDAHDEYQFNVQQTLESQNSQLASHVIAILMPQTPAGQSEIDHV